MSATALTARAEPHVRRLDVAALRGVLVREVVNFKSFWRSSTFSSTVEGAITVESSSDPQRGQGRAT